MDDLGSVPVLDALRALVEATPSGGRANVLQATLDELERLYHLESLARDVVRHLVPPYAGAMTYTHWHPDVQGLCVLLGLPVVSKPSDLKLCPHTNKPCERLDCIRAELCLRSERGKT